MKKSFEKELPQGYQRALVIDAKNVKFGIIMNVVAVLILIAVVAATMLIIKFDFSQLINIDNLLKNSLRLSALSAFLIAYLILHELLHGLAYKLTTGQKLKFGLTLTVAYCGVPDIFVYRKTALIALLTPFLVFLLIFAGAVVFLPYAVDKVLASILLGCHIGGCSGDLFDVFILLFKFKQSSVLIHDDGPTQSFYVYKG